jgi:broad specificity phosphatase PhoE
MKLLLARHGNTFTSEMTPVFVGSANDMPLVEEGERQAIRFAEFCEMKALTITAVYCGPLKRTRRFAEIVCERLSLSCTPVVDERLNELDYGGWSGKTNEEVATEFGDDVLKAWNGHAVWPENSHWGANEEAVIADVVSYIDDLRRRHGGEDVVLSVSSNGRLRYFLKLLPQLFDEMAAGKSLKVAPGNACQLTLERDGECKFDYWNQSPAKLLAP